MQMIIRACGCVLLGQRYQTAFGMMQYLINRCACVVDVEVPHYDDIFSSSLQFREQIVAMAILREVCRTF